MHGVCCSDKNAPLTHAGAASTHKTDQPPAGCAMPASPHTLLINPDLPGPAAHIMFTTQFLPLQRQLLAVNLPTYAEHTLPCCSTPARQRLESPRPPSPQQPLTGRTPHTAASAGLRPQQLDTLQVRQCKHRYSSSTHIHGLLREPSTSSVWGCYTCSTTPTHNCWVQCRRFSRMQLQRCTREQHRECAAVQGRSSCQPPVVSNSPKR